MLSSIILGVKNLFKRLLVLFCVLLLAFPVQATVYIVEPLDQTASQDEELSFGKISRGETLKLVVKKKSDLDAEWDSLEIDSTLLPSDWKIGSLSTDKTLIAFATVPKDAPISTQRIKFTVINSNFPLFGESFYGTVSVQESLLSASIENLGKETVLGESSVFDIVINNDSITSHSVVVESTLPSYWFTPTVVELGPHETKPVELKVDPYSYGEKNFSFKVSSLLNDSEFIFPARLDVMPTLGGMYWSALAGFPFFSPGMLPFYLVNGFLGLLS